MVDMFAQYTSFGAFRAGPYAWEVRCELKIQHGSTKGTKGTMCGKMCKRKYVP